MAVIFEDGIVQVKMSEKWSISFSKTGFKNLTTFIYLLWYFNPRYSLNRKAVSFYPHARFASNARFSYIYSIVDKKAPHSCRASILFCGEGGIRSR